MIQQFQKDLINKLNFKASSKVPKQGLLFKSFKFYDLNGVGYVSREEFYKVISKIGVVFNSESQRKEVFDHYDKYAEQKIYYREFITQLLNEPKVLMQKPPKNVQQLKESKIESLKPMHESRNLQLSKKSIKLNTGEEVIDYIKNTLRNRGIQSILKLAVDLKELDTNKSHHLSYQKILNLLNYLKKQDVSKLFSHFKLNSGELNYAELIYQIREILTPERTVLINSTFQRLDSNKERQIPIETVITKFEPNQLSSNNQFSRYIEQYCKFQGIDDGIFTDEDFADFFGFIAFYFTSTEDFRSYILSAFPEEERKSVRSSRSRRQFENPSAIKKQQQSTVEIVGNFKKKDLKQSHISQFNPHPQKAQSIISQNIPKNQQFRQPEKSRVSQQSHYVKQIELILLRIKKRLASKGSRGYLYFEKALKLADNDQDYFINLLEFKKVIKEQRIDITETQTHIVFQIFDQQSTGLINYPEFIYAIKGEVPQNRKKLIQRVWEKVKTTQQYTTYNNLKNLFQARSHPDVKNGRKYEEEITKQLNQSLLLIQDLNGVRNEEILKQDFVEYLQNLSASTPDNQLFEAILISTWRLGSVNKIQQQYAGSRKLFDMKSNAYLIDHHRYMINGGTVSQNAPFGTYNQKTNYSTESGRKLDF